MGVGRERATGQSQAPQGGQALTHVVDRTLVTIDAEQVVGVDESGGVDGADDAGQAVFAGQDGGVAELAALVGDDGGDFPLKWARMLLAMVYKLGRVLNCV